LSCRRCRRRHQDGQLHELPQVLSPHRSDESTARGRPRAHKSSRKSGLHSIATRKPRDKTAG
jgi:hypothetical protein